MDFDQALEELRLVLTDQDGDGEPETGVAAQQSPLYDPTPDTPYDNVDHAMALLSRSARGTVPGANHMMANLQSYRGKGEFDDLLREYNDSDNALFNDYPKSAIAADLAGLAVPGVGAFRALNSVGKVGKALQSPLGLGGLGATYAGADDLLDNPDATAQSTGMSAGVGGLAGLLLPGAVNAVKSRIAPTAQQQLTRQAQRVEKELAARDKRIMKGHMQELHNRDLSLGPSVQEGDGAVELLDDIQRRAINRQKKMQDLEELHAGSPDLPPVFRGRSQSGGRGPAPGRTGTDQNPPRSRETVQDARGSEHHKHSRADNPHRSPGTSQRNPISQKTSNSPSPAQKRVIREAYFDALEKGQSPIDPNALSMSFRGREASSDQIATYLAELDKIARATGKKTPKTKVEAMRRLLRTGAVKFATPATVGTSALVDLMSQNSGQIESRY